MLIKVCLAYSTTRSTKSFYKKHYAECVTANQSADCHHQPSFSYTKYTLDACPFYYSIDHLLHMKCMFLRQN